MGTDAEQRILEKVRQRKNRELTEQEENLALAQAALVGEIPDPGWVP